MEDWHDCHESGSVGRVDIGAGFCGNDLGSLQIRGEMKAKNSILWQ